MIFYVVEIAGKKYIEAKGVIDETNYTHAVNQLEEVMLAVYPEVFQRETLKDLTDEFIKVERDDGETDVITANEAVKEMNNAIAYEEARRLDLRFRERQMPMNSRGARVMVSKPEEEIYRTTTESGVRRCH